MQVTTGASATTRSFRYTSSEQPISTVRYEPVGAAALVSSNQAIGITSCGTTTLMADSPHFDGSIVESVNGAQREDIFWGLHYTEDGLDLMTLRTPDVRVQSGRAKLTQGTQRKNLMLITHGTNSSVGTVNDWVLQLTNAMAGNMRSPGEWDVVTLDSREFAGGTNDAFNPFPRVALPAGYAALCSLNACDFNPIWAANHAVSVGESLAQWLDDNQLDDYQNVHVLGHSSGAWLADALANALRTKATDDGRPIAIQATFFDAYTPQLDPSGTSFWPDHFERIGSDAPLRLGDSAHYADHFVDKRYGPPGTHSRLPHALNIDVTSRRPRILKRLRRELALQPFMAVLVLHQLGVAAAVVSLWFSSIE